MDPKLTQEQFDKRLDALTTQLADLSAAVKKGARNNAGDAKALQAIHDATDEMGMMCASGSKAGARWSADDMKALTSIHDAAINLGAACPKDSAAGNSPVKADGATEETAEPNAKPTATGESLEKKVQDIRDAFYETFSSPSPTPYVSRYCLDVLEGAVIARIGDDTYKIPYTLDADGGAVFAEQAKWEQVQQEWVPAKMAGELVVNFGGSVKATDDGHLKGYVVTFGSEKTPDDSSYKDFFTKETDFGAPVDGMRGPVYFHHCIPIKAKRSKKIVRFTEKVGEATLKMDEAGILIDAILTNTKYKDAIKANINALGWSSGTAGHLIIREGKANGTHFIKRWPLGLDFSLTPDPADKRQRAQVASIKSVADVELDFDDTDTDGEAVAPAIESPTGGEGESDIISALIHSFKKDDNTMDPKDKPNQTDINALAQALLPALKTAIAEDAAKVEEEKKKKEAEAAAFKAAVAEEVKSAIAAQRGARTPVNAGGVKTDAPNLNMKTERGDDEFKAFNWYLKTGDGVPIRTGDAYESALAAGDIMPGMKTTYNLLESTQYQGQEAVPTLVANKIIERRDPISIVRKAGADVQQVSSNAIVIPIEKASPEKFVLTTVDGSNTFDQTTVQPMDKASVTIYMFTKSVPIDIQLLADATFDVEAWVGRRFARAMALTENYYFTIGTGSGQPQGLVIGASAGVTSASSSALTFGEMNSVFHSLTSEYRDDVSWFMNGTVEGLLRGVTGNPAYFVGNGGYQGAIGNTGQPQGAGWFVAPNSKVFNAADMDSYGTTKVPVVVGNVGAGFAITERAGFTVLRDPYTLANKGLVNILFYYRNSSAVVNTAAFKKITMPSF